jgi:hypothetical protein
MIKKNKIIGNNLDPKIYKKIPYADIVFTSPPYYFDDKTLSNS